MYGGIMAKTLGVENINFYNDKLRYVKGRRNTTMVSIIKANLCH